LQCPPHGQSEEADEDMGIGALFYVKKQVFLLA